MLCWVSLDFEIKSSWEEHYLILWILLKNICMTGSREVTSRNISPPDGWWRVQAVDVGCTAKEFRSRNAWKFSLPSKWRTNSLMAIFRQLQFKGLIHHLWVARGPFWVVSKGTGVGLVEVALLGSVGPLYNHYICQQSLDKRIKYTYTASRVRMRLVLFLKYPYQEIHRAFR